MSSTTTTTTTKERAKGASDASPFWKFNAICNRSSSNGNGNSNASSNNNGAPRTQGRERTFRRVASEQGSSMNHALCCRLPARFPIPSHCDCDCLR